MEGKRRTMCGMWEGRGTSMPPPGALPPTPYLHVISSLGTLQTPSFWGFVEASLHTQNGLNHCVSLTDSTSSLSPPLSPPWKSGGV